MCRIRFTLVQVDFSLYINISVYGIVVSAIRFCSFCCRSIGAFSCSRSRTGHHWMAVGVRHTATRTSVSFSPERDAAMSERVVSEVEYVRVSGRTVVSTKASARTRRPEHGRNSPEDIFAGILPVFTIRCCRSGVAACRIFTADTAFSTFRCVRRKAARFSVFSVIFRPAPRAGVPSADRACRASAFTVVKRRSAVSAFANG